MISTYTTPLVIWTADSGATLHLVSRLSSGSPWALYDPPPQVLTPLPGFLPAVVRHLVPVRGELVGELDGVPLLPGDGRHRVRLGDDGRRSGLV